MSTRCRTVGVALAGLLLTSVGLSGCAAAAAVDLQLPAQNRSQWLMPTDAYLPGEAAMEATDYAEMLLDSACMGEAGYPDPVPFKDVSTSWQSDTWNSVGMRLFNEKIAANYGYHLDPRESGGNPDAWQKFLHGDLSDAASAALAACRAQPPVKIPDADGFHNRLSGLRVDAEEKAQHDGEVQAAVGRWHECMKPLGIPDLTQSPNEMPSDSQRASFGLNDGSLVAPPSAEEVRQASFDAACRESSGWSEAYYQASWNEDVKVLRDNLDTFERAQPQIKDAYETALKVIAERAPSN